MKHIITTLALVVATSASANDGNTLLTRLNGDLGGYERGWAAGYISAAHTLLDEVTHCTPNNVTNGQTQDVVKAYLVRHPELRHKNAALLIGQAFIEAFPCKTASKKGGAA
jgi:hypothetical protein